MAQGMMLTICKLDMPYWSSDGGMERAIGGE